MLDSGMRWPPPSITCNRASVPGSWVCFGSSSITTRYWLRLSYNVATWRWLKELLSMLATVRRSTPWRAAASRSMSSITWRMPASPCASTSTSSGRPRSAAATFGAHWRSGAVSADSSWNSYLPLLPAPSRRMSWSTHRYRLPPGNLGRRARRRSITCWLETPRSASGFILIMMKALLTPLLPPIYPMMSSMAGSDSSSLR
ncbi:hypothetical protein D3C73_950300 [compost metagenome]